MSDNAPPTTRRKRRTKAEIYRDKLEEIHQLEAEALAEQLCAHPDIERMTRTLTALSKQIADWNRFEKQAAASLEKAHAKVALWSDRLEKAPIMLNGEDGKSGLNGEMRGLKEAKRERLRELAAEGWTPPEAKTEESQES